MNIYDSHLIADLFQEQQIEHTENIYQATYIIIHTCSVRKNAEERILNRLEHIQGLKKNHPFIKVILSGCLAQHKAQEITQRFSCIDLVLGPDQYGQLSDFIKGNSSQKILDHLDQQLYTGFYPTQEIYPQKTFAAFVPIIRGCNQFCSYCIVPYLRGRERSLPPENIVREINHLDPKKFKEVMLLGQNVNSYQFEGIDFPQLLEIIDRETDQSRIRFMSPHPLNFTSEVIDKIEKLDSVCESVHLPLQSGSDKILKEMRRQYSAEKYFSIVKELRSRIPSIAITTDIIVGFPGETEEDFQATLEMVKKSEFEDAFMYKYSKREGTVAAKYQETLTEQEKIERLNQLIELQVRQSNRVFQKRIGDTVEVLFESVSKRNKDELIGRSRQSLMAAVPAQVQLLGSIQQVKIDQVSGKTLRGNLI